MKTIKGPAIFLTQFAGDAPPFNNLKSIAGWAAGLGFKGVQIPTWDARLFDLKRAAESQTYCDDVKGILAERGLEVTELSTASRRPRSAANRPRARRGRSSSSSSRRARRAASASRSTPHSPAAWRGHTSIRFRSGRPG